MIRLTRPEKIEIGRKVISASGPVFVIAEAGINHNGDMKLAEKLIREARLSGADAVKFQTYATERRVAKDNPVYGILKKCELSFKDQEKLFQLARSEGILFFSTPFDEDSVDFLVERGAPLLKIASFDIVNLKFLKYAAKKGVPIIVSRGMASEEEVDRAVQIFEESAVPFVLLHCVSSYPNQEENAHLRVIQSLRERYRCWVGYSDHTLGIRVPVLAVAGGAVAIEKHFTLDRAMEGPDHHLSCNPPMMREMVNQIRETEKILGEGEIKLCEAERSALIFRRVTV